MLTLFLVGATSSLSSAWLQADLFREGGDDCVLAVTQEAAEAVFGESFQRIVVPSNFSVRRVAPVLEKSAR